MLKVPYNEPVGVSTSKGKYRFLRDYDVKRHMQQACIDAYPDEKHYMRQHIHRVVPHSNRVTAAVCLQQGGAHNDEIAFRLRWDVTSVPTYLRDCFQAVGNTLQKLICGMLRQWQPFKTE